MIEPLLAQLRAYKKKYYLNRLIGGSLLSLALLLSAWLLVNAVEYFAWLPTWGRAVLFFGYLALAVALLYTRVWIPAARLLNLSKPLSDEEAAQQIGHYFPQVADKLLNTLQLSRLDAQTNSLLAAAISQRTAELSLVPFASAIRLSQNRRYLRYVLPPLAVLALLLVLVPQFITESSARILNYSQHYVPQAPFQWHLLNESLQAYKDEDFTLRLSLEGKALPDQVFVVVDGRRQKMEATQAGQWEFTLRNVQSEKPFAFEAAGFVSPAYELDLVSRPSLNSFIVELDYPDYVGKKDESLTNVGNLSLPAGTVVRWKIASAATDTVLMRTEADAKTVAAEKSGETFSLSRRMLQSTAYRLLLKNAYTTAKEEIRYQIDVIPDQYPSISLEHFKDSSLLSYLALGGNLSDDYGLSRLELHYRIKKSGQQSPGAYRVKPLRITPGALAQTYLHTWYLDSLKLGAGDEVDYFLTVYDNDRVQGSKASRTSPQVLRLPSQAELDRSVAESQAQAEKQLAKAVSKAEQLRKETQRLKERLRGKRDLGYQEKKAIEDLLKKQEEAEKEIEQLNQQAQQLQEKQNRFQNQSSDLQNKMQELQKLMTEMLDPETKRLMQELQRLLDEKNQNPDQIAQKLEQLEKKEFNLSKELDRSLELFKKLQFQAKLEQTIAQLNKAAEEQEKLAEKTEKAQDKDLNAAPKDKNTAKDKASSDKKDDKKGEGSKDPDKDNKGDKNTQDPGDKGSEDKNAKDKSQKPDSSGQKSGDKSDKGDKNEAGKSEEKNSEGNQENKDSEGKESDSPSDKKEEGASPLQQEQQALKEQLDQLKEDLQKLNELGQKMDQKEEVPQDAQQDLKEAGQDQQDAQKQMAQKNKKGASKKQKSAAQKMKKAAQSMQQMQMEMEGQENEENEEDLRAILENLLTLSFDQEELMKEFRSVNRLDPRFIALGQKQLKLKDDATLIQDSLLALAKRVFQIQSFVTREVAAMKGHIEEAVTDIRNRFPERAAGKQQLAMTSMNNLALMLSESLKQMQEQSQQQQQSAGKMKSKKKKPGNKPSPGNLGQMQKELNKQIEQLQKGQKSGRQLSEELGQIAAKQEALRRAMQEMEKLMQQQPGGKEKEGGTQPGGMGQLKQLMEESEKDIVNKRLSPELIRRNQEIVTRLLEAENSMRERELDNKRESKTGKELPRSLPPSLEEYLKQKEKQVELLKTVPPSLTPFYKQETSRYFQQLGTMR